MRFPVVLTVEEAGVNVSFPDIPEALTFGSDREDALVQAGDALETALDFYFDDKRPVPSPTKPKRGQALVELPASLAAKVMLHNEMLAQHVRPVDLARRLKIQRQEVNRLLNPRHPTKIDSIQLALGALGKRFELTVEAA